MKTILILSTIAGIGTCFGAIIVCLFAQAKENSLAFFLGLATGVGFAVIIFDLLPSALIYGNFPTALISFLLGIILLSLVNWFLTIIKSHKEKNRRNYLLKMGYLIAIGIALHDLPEGIAIAAGYSATKELGLLLVIAMGLHNIPEGMATATPLRMGGMAVWKIVLITAFVSLFTPLGTLIGLWLVNLSPSLLAALLGVAAGAMAYIMVEELYPESLRVHPNIARLGMLIGILVILVLTFFG